MRLVPFVVLITEDEARKIGQLVADAPADVRSQLDATCMVVDRGWTPAELLAGHLVRIAIELHEQQMSS